MLSDNKEQTKTENGKSVETTLARSRRNLRADCKNCFGLCCTALYFSASDGFPVNKEAGQPCPNLQTDYRCRVHNDLWERGYKGCSAFDCFGAGPKVAQITFGGRDWRRLPDSAKQMFETFQIMRQLHELLWYLTEALSIEIVRPLHARISALLDETERLTRLGPDELLHLDVNAHRAHVNTLLLKVSELVRAEALGAQQTPSRRQKTLGPRADLIAADLRRADLRGIDLRGALLIAADLRGVVFKGTDLIGADFRDADIRGADLSESIFLTQAQLNVAKGDFLTKLPAELEHPAHWSAEK